MAEYGRSGDHQTRDREGSRHGRDVGDDRGGWGRGWSDRHRSGETSRGGGMFGPSSGHGGDDWEHGRREELGWGSGGRSAGGSSGGRDEQGGGRGERDRGSDRHREQAWGAQDRSHGDRPHADRSHSDRSHSDRSHSDRDERGWGGEGGRSAHDDQRRERGFGHDDRHEGLPIDETSRLIASNKVEGTAVYARDGRRLGSIYNFMVDKRSGKVEYAVMSYGGFLGMGTRYYPMPWDILSYDTRLGGYRVDMMERDLERAPSFDRDSEPSFDTSYGRRVRGWYGLGS